MPEISLVLPMFKHYHKLLARSYSTHAWLLSSNGLMVNSFILPPALHLSSFVLYLSKLTANRFSLSSDDFQSCLFNEDFSPYFYTSVYTIAHRTSTFGYLSDISSSKCPIPKSYSSPLSKLFLWNLGSLGRWHHRSLVHQIQAQESCCVPPSFLHSSKSKCSQSYNDLCLLRSFSNCPPLSLVPIFSQLDYYHSPLAHLPASSLSPLQSAVHPVT